MRACHTTVRCALGVLLLPALLAGCTKGADKDDPPALGEPPLVTIDEPADGGSINTPSAVRMVGRAEDEEDGTLEGDALVWASDIDGELGVGASLTIGLSEGPHLLTLTATDSDGEIGVASASVDVSSVNAPPTPAILLPLDGSWVVVGDSLLLRGRATDLEDGDLEGPALIWTSSEGGLLGSGANLTVAGLELGEHLIVLTAIDSQGAEGRASIGITVAPVGTNLPAAVTVVSPAPGSSFVEGEAVHLDGSAVDPEDGILLGPALVWSSDRDGLLGDGAPLDVLALSVGIHSLTLSATDSGGVTGSASVSVSVNPVGNAAPSVSIGSPAAGATFNEGEVISLTASATDPEDGALSGAALSWSSSVDGLLGTGSPLDVDDLSAGGHLLSVIATDSGGAQAIADVTVTVLPANEPPLARVEAPADGSEFTQGELIRFEGSGIDPEDGALTGSALIWQSHLDGPMGTGSPLDFPSLTAGVHQITLTTVDSGGRTGADAITITVDASAVDLPPVAVLSGSAAGFVGVPYTADGTASSDPDGTVVEYSFDFDDGSAATTGASTVTHTWAVPGTFLVTLTVTDDAGGTGTDTLLVDVTIPARLPTVVLDDPWSLGTFCDLELDAQDRPHLLFKNQGYQQVWYATEGAGGWSFDLVDGPGLSVGGLVGASGDLALDAAGQPHAAYLVGDELHYATLQGGGWLVDAPGGPTAATGFPVALAFDPANNDRVTVAYTTSEGGEYPVVSWRNQGGSWGDDTWIAPNTSQYGFRGGLAFRGNGLAYLSLNEDALGMITWSANNGFGAYQPVFDGADNVFDPAPVILDDSNQPIVAHRSGIDAFDGQWTHSDFANTTIERVAMTWDAVVGEPVIAFRNDQGDLEIVRPGPPGEYWAWDNQGPMDSGDDFSIVVDTAGDVRACFFRGGLLMVY